MVRVVDYTISGGIPIISQSGSVCTHVGETLAKWMEEGDTVRHMHNDIKGTVRHFGNERIDTTLKSVQ